MPHPSDRKYSKEHEWAKLESGLVRVGITDYAQSELGDIVYVELPKPGRRIKQGEAFVIVESVKSASDVYAPISGEVKEVNKALEEKPELVNQSPHDQGWLVVIAPSQPQEFETLLSAADYEAHVGSLKK